MLNSFILCLSYNTKCWTFYSKPILSLPNVEFLHSMLILHLPNVEFLNSMLILHLPNVEIFLQGLSHAYQMLNAFISFLSYTYQMLNSFVLCLSYTYQMSNSFFKAYPTPTRRPPSRRVWSFWSRRWRPRCPGGKSRWSSTRNKVSTCCIVHTSR